LLSTVSEAYRARELIMNFMLRDLRTRYRRTVLGWTWSLLNPISSVLVYTIVFGVFLKSKPPPGVPSGQDLYALYLISGLVAWNFVAGSVTGGMSSLVGNAGLIKKVYFPRVAVVVATVGSNVITLLIELLVVAIFFLIMGSNVLPWIPLLMVVVVLQTVWMIGIALMLSVLNAYFRDMQHLVGTVLLQLVFYLTPIVYPTTLPEKRLDGWMLTLFRSNPVFQIVSAYRSLLWDLRNPQMQTWAYLICGGGVVLWMGILVFDRYEPRLAEEL